MDEIDARYEEAVQNLPKVECQLDILLWGTEEEKEMLVRDLGKGVEDIERRVNEYLRNQEQLITTDKGAVRQCIRNVVTVLGNDPKFRGVICYNMMTDRNDIVKDLGWYRESPVLTDSDIDHIMLYLEENYSLTTEKKIKSAINVVAMENKYHPIQEKLNSLVWDKKERIKDVLYHFLGADRNVYVYEAMKVLLLGAISRVFHPGTKFEYMLILVGGQGAGKSTFSDSLP